MPRKSGCNLHAFELALGTAVRTASPSVGSSKNGLISAEFLQFLCAESETMMSSIIWLPQTDSLCLVLKRFDIHFDRPRKPQHEANDSCCNVAMRSLIFNDARYHSSTYAGKAIVEPKRNGRNCERKEVIGQGNNFFSG
jgi:hypothetical protein